MTHALELGTYLVLSAFLIYKSLERPIWAAGYYFLNWFALPGYWAWGSLLGPLQYERWSLYAALLLLASVWMNGREREFRHDSSIKRVSVFAILIAINGLLVHILFAHNYKYSWEVYVEMAKFIVLYFVLQKVIQSTRDFYLLLWFLVIGLLYWGVQARFLGTLTMVEGRLEKFGGPGCYNSNELANVLAALLPLSLGFLVVAKKNWHRLIILGTQLLVLDIMLRTVSRGGVVALAAAALVLPFVASGRVRKYAVRTVALGVLSFILLAGNPEIVARFMTLFGGEGDSKVERLAASAQASRQFFWKVGLDLLADYPLGSGGDTFAYEKGLRYLNENNSPWYNNSVHQGFIREAMDWGVQGLLLHLGFTFAAIWSAFKTSRFRKKIGDFQTSFLGPCLIGGFVALLVGSLFGDFYHLEWGYWLVIVSVCYTKIFGQANYGVLPEAKISAAQAENGDPDFLRELSLGTA